MVNHPALELKRESPTEGASVSCGTVEVDRFWGEIPASPPNSPMCAVEDRGNNSFLEKRVCD